MNGAYLSPLPSPLLPMSYLSPLSFLILSHSFPVGSSLSVNLCSLVPLRVALRNHLRPAKAGACRHVQIVRSEPAGPSREEVQRRPIEGERGRTVEVAAVDRGPQVHRCGGPRVGSRRPPGDPQVLAADPARTPGGVRGNEHLQAVAPNRRAGVAIRPVQLRDIDARP